MVSDEPSTSVHERPFLERRTFCGRFASRRAALVFDVGFWRRRRTTFCGRSVDGRLRACGHQPKEVPMANSITADLSEGYRRVAHVLSEEHLGLIARARDTTNVRLAERTRLLAQIVACYL